LPIPAMLAKPALNPADIKRILEKLGDEIICECKYDGERTHLHYSKEQLTMYSRNGEQQNDKYGALHSELYDYLSESNIESCVLDGEIIALDSNGRICSFQEVGKKNSSEKDMLKVVAFDILWYNKKKTIDMSLIERKKLLDFVLVDASPVIERIDYTLLKLSDSNYESKLLQLFNKAKNENCEGLIIKTASKENSMYDISGSRRYWTKVY
jgi:ATP-dependent DNA ligase